jgi:hypothetical protein
MAAVTNITRQQGAAGLPRAYAATDALALTSRDGGIPLIVCYAQLTGAMTINLTTTGLSQFQEVIFMFSADASPRIVTFGTNIVSSGTHTVAATKDSIVKGMFDGTNLRILSREIGA